MKGGNESKGFFIGFVENGEPLEGIEGIRAGWPPSGSIPRREPSADVLTPGRWIIGCMQST